MIIVNTVVNAVVHIYNGRGEMDIFKKRVTTTIFLFDLTSTITSSEFYKKLEIVLFSSVEHFEDLTFNSSSLKETLSE